jgi:hypothetical protein
MLGITQGSRLSPISRTLLEEWTRRGVQLAQRTELKARVAREVGEKATTEKLTTSSSLFG